MSWGNLHGQPTGANLVLISWIKFHVLSISDARFVQDQSTFSASIASRTIVSRCTSSTTRMLTAVSRSSPLSPGVATTFSGSRGSCPGEPKWITTWATSPSCHIPSWWQVCWVAGSTRLVPGLSLNDGRHSRDTRSTIISSLKRMTWRRMTVTTMWWWIGTAQLLWISPCMNCNWCV